jgi:hypothetical protein
MEVLQPFVDDAAVFLESAVPRVAEYFTTMDIDPGVFQSLGVGFALGLGALGYLAAYPGEPHDGWELPTEEDRFYALKRAIERETPEELEKKLAEEARAVEGMKSGKGAGKKKKKKKKKNRSQKSNNGEKGRDKDVVPSELPNGWTPKIDDLEPQPGQATIAHQDAIVAGSYEGGSGGEGLRNRKKKGKASAATAATDSSKDGEGKDESCSLNKEKQHEKRAAQLKKELERTGGLEERPEDKVNAQGLSKVDLEIEDFLKLSPLEQEAAAEVKALEAQFGNRNNLRRIVKGKQYSDAKRGGGWCRVLLRVINWCIPLLLIAGLLWAVNRDYGVNVIGLLRAYFPREAAVFQSIAGETDSAKLFGVKVI